jgi:hypothetical protein
VKKVWHIVDYLGWGRLPRIGDELPSAGRRWRLMSITPRVNRFGKMGAVLVWQCEGEWRSSGLRSKSLTRIDRPESVPS